MLRIINLTLLPFLFFGTFADEVELGKLLEQRLKLYKEITLVKTQWQAEDIAYKKRIALKINQLAQLNKSKQELSKKTQELKVKRDSQNSELSIILATSKKLHQEIDLAEKDLLKVIKELPLPLQNLIPKARELSQENKDFSAVKLAERSRRLASLVKDLQKIQSQSHFLKETLKVNDNSQEYRVLYLGSALGYFISHDGSTAGILTREKSIWTPQVHNELANDINKAIAIQQGKAKPDLVQLLLPSFKEESK